MKYMHIFNTKFYQNQACKKGSATKEKKRTRKIKKNPNPTNHVNSGLFYFLFYRKRGWLG